MALINTTTTGILGTTVYGDGAGPLTVQQDGVTIAKVTRAPAFAAYISADQSVSNDVATKVNIDTEYFDTDSCYDTSLKRFTPNVAGYYQVNSIVRANGPSTFTGLYTFLFKNGSSFQRLAEYNFNMNASNAHGNASTLIYLNGSTDYIELYALTFCSPSANGTFSASPTAGTGQNACQFSAYLVRAA
jgi:hypothetical protein